MPSSRSSSESTLTSSDDGVEYPRQGGFPNANNAFWARMRNDDPSNEYMYQIPLTGTKGKDHSEDVIDPEALKVRLQTLGLQGPSTATIIPPGHIVDDSLELVTPPDPSFEPYYQNHSHASRPFSVVHDLYPEDSISMYRPRPHPAQSTSGLRKGGTDVDPGEGAVNVERSHAHPGLYREEDGMSDFSADGGVTANTPRSMAYLEPTAAPGSARTRGTYGAGGMDAMRERLLEEQAFTHAARTQELTAQLNDTARLASALTRLQSTEEQLRALQATLIGERVARTQIQRDASSRAEDARDCREELASAVRALRRARDEGKKSEEDRRALTRAYEMAQVKLNKYQLEMSVREAVSRGREKGRQEAWDEAAKWMGVSPPIPVEPIRRIPEAVLRQTPRTGQTQLFQHDGIYGGGALGQNGFDNSGQTAQHFSQHHVPPHNPQTTYQHYDRDNEERPYRPHQNQQMEYGDSHGLSKSNQQRNGASKSHSTKMTPDHPDDHQHFSVAPQRSTDQHARRDDQVRHTQSGVQNERYQAAHGANTTAHHAPRMSEFQPDPVAYDEMSRSVLHGNIHLPAQHPHGGTAVTDHPSSRHASQPKAPRQQEPSSLPRGPEPPSRHHAADSYLDRIEHDTRLQQMLSDAHSKSLHTSQFPPTEAGGMSDKPLPDPFTPHHHTSGQRSAAESHGPRHGEKKSRRRESLTDGMHPNMMMSTIPDGDRYPQFPGAQPHGGLAHVGHRKTHSRMASGESVNPAAYALPASTMHTAYNTPHTTHKFPPSTGFSSRQTPQSQSAQARSKMAGALRNGTEFGQNQAELYQIEEENLARQRTRSEGGHKREADLMQSAIMRNMSGPAAPQLRKAPSMPPPKHQPRPVMPGMLNGKSASEYHPSQPRPQATHQSSRSAIGTGPRGNDPPRSHPMFVPPSMAPMAVSGGIEDVQGPRHSALGLEGIEAQSGGANAFGQEYSDDPAHADHPAHGGFGGFSGPEREQEGAVGRLSSLLGLRKAPTITIQPPSSMSRSNLQSQVASEMSPLDVPQNPSTVPPPKTPKTPRSTTSPTAQTTQPETTQHPTKRKTTIITEYFDSPTRPHNIPLPHSRAPTVIAPATPAHPTTIPLPPSHPTAPTVYEGSPPDSHSLRTDRTGRSHVAHKTDTIPGALQMDNLRRIPPHILMNMPGVSIKDYAAASPLPESRGTSMIGSPKAVTRSNNELDDNTRRNGANQTKRKSVLPSNGHGHGSRNGSHPLEPHQIPLPASRAPTIIRPRASTYARTEGTIDEVTEEESGKENRAGRKRW